jgi:NTE family protein
VTRTGVVLGAGGVLGAAWTIGALAALQDARGEDPREAEVLVGTSAGSVLASFLGCGIGVDVLLDHQRGIVNAEAPDISYDPDKDSGGALPPLPRPGIGSPRGVLSSALQPWKITPMGALAAILPQGRGSLEPIGTLVDAVCPRGAWAGHPQTWIVAMDYDSGRRVVFGRDGSPHASLRDAVMSSCAIPGWYAPVRIGGRRYVDGGAWSPTNMDAAPVERGSRVLCLNPTGSMEGSVRTAMGAMGLVSRNVAAVEALALRRRGARVKMVAPDAASLRAIGPNLMDSRPRRRVIEAGFEQGLRLGRGD